MEEYMNNIDSSAATFEEKINRYMTERTKLDTNEVYEKAKCKYPVILTNTYALENGKEDWEEDFQIVCGESSVGKFFLYDNGLYIVFDVERKDGNCTHWHPIDTEEAIKDVMLFMEGICKE